jgi:hypothetical protein
MKQTLTQDIGTKTLTGRAPAHEAAPLPVRRGCVFGGGFWARAEVVALLLSFPAGASLLTAGEKPCQPHYRFTEIALPGPGQAIGINDGGLVTGFYTDPTTGDVFSFLYKHGALTTGISAPGATFTALGPANNRGVESGNYGDETHQQPVFYDVRSGVFSPLPEIPGMPFNYGDGINDFGHASGVAYAAGDFYNGGTGLGLNWIWDGAHYSFFTVPGADDGAAAGGINNRDQISGLYVDSTGTPHGFLKDGDHYTTLDAPGALYTVAFGINNLGVVAGLYVNPDHSHHGYLWRDGKFVTVDANVSGSVGNLWYGSNDQGDLAGNYYDSAHAPHAVIAERLDREEDCKDNN